MEDLVPFPRPIRNQVIVRQNPRKERVSAGGIVALPSPEDWDNVGTVIAVGPGKPRGDGSRTPMPAELVPGVKVIFKRRAGSALIQDHRDAPLYPKEWQDILVLRYSGDSKDYSEDPRGEEQGDIHLIYADDETTQS